MITTLQNAMIAEQHNRFAKLHGSIKLLINGNQCGIENVDCRSLLSDLQNPNVLVED